MRPYAENTVTFRLLLGGYLAALERFHEARLTRDSSAAFRPLFEALNWAVALDDQVAARWAPHGQPLGLSWSDQIANGEYVRAVRFARNRVHHQWADALVLTDGFTFPATFPIAFHEWRWRPSSELPVGRSDQDRQARYDELLAGQPARFALDVLDAPYRQLADLLEPAITPST